ncbi:hypothetical protein C2G38_2224205 [Gigaspora rosea]|uniref:Uncharacterized protein n=1 Tax=Gigaspora rosea TaxID=44941 RepID=A0A397U254_9GLOM|nr:hypothetical protein C2G38_2224205 [Gigaspora rosea]
MQTELSLQDREIIHILMNYINKKKNKQQATRRLQLVAKTDQKQNNSKDLLVEQYITKLKILLSEESEFELENDKEFELS